MKPTLDTYFKCLGYIVSEVRWDTTCPHQLKSLRYIKNGRNFIDLEKLRAMSETEVMAVAHQVQRDNWKKEIETEEKTDET